VPAELIAQFTAKTETRQRKVGGTSVEPEPEPDTESYDEPEEGEDYDEEEEVESDVMSGVF